MNTQTQGKSTLDKDRETLISIVKEMAVSTSGEQSTKHWAKDALWFDIPPFASRGVPPAIKMFDTVFSSFKSCNVSILETDTFISDTMGFVCTIQKTEIVFKNEIAKTAMVRQTDCFIKDDNNEWLLVHQHASVPSGGEWDGEIIV